MVQQDFAGQPVRAIAPDPFTYGCAFGDRHVMLWGADRAEGAQPGSAAPC
jgi:hypothetical protein